MSSPRGPAPSPEPGQARHPAHEAVVLPLVLRPATVGRVRDAAIVGICALATLNVLALVVEYGFGRGRLFGLVEFAELNEEGSLGTWVAAVLLVATSLVALACARADTRERGRWRHNWRLLAAVLLFMSIDEVGTLHDDLGEALHEHLDTGGVFYFAWTVPALVLGAVFLILQLRFVWALPTPTRRGVIIAGIVFVTGAAGLEFVESALFESAEERATLVIELITLVEEVFEKSAVALLLVTELRFLLALGSSRADGSGAAVVATATGPRVREG